MEEVVIPHYASLCAHQFVCLWAKQTVLFQSMLWSIQRISLIKRSSVRARKKVRVVH